MRYLLLLLFSATLLTAGCSSEARRVEVQGDVSFEGAPVPDGDIFFVSEGNVADRNPGKIKDGRFAMPVSPGKKRVEIHASRIKPGGPLGAMGEPVAEGYIPDRFNTQTTLTADVSPSGPNTFEFKLE